MEFLYKLYSNDYFGIGLFIVITVLAFSFLVILFFGKKDEKSRNKQIANDIKLENNELNNETNISNEEIKTDALETISLPTENIPVMDEKVPTLQEESIQTSDTEENVSLEETVKEEGIVDPFVSSNKVLNSDLVTNEPIIDEVQNSGNQENNVFDVPSLEDVLNQELNFPENSIEEKKDEPIIEFNIETPVIEEPVVNNIFTEPEVKEDTPKKVSMPTQFSSVYLTKEKEESTIEPVVEETKEEVIAPIPLKPEFDLPKPIDLPKLSKESGVTPNNNENIISSMLSENNDNNLNNIFGNIEEETYTIEK